MLLLMYLAGSAWTSWRNWTPICWKMQRVCSFCE